MQRDQIWMCDRSKEREHIFTRPTALQCETRADNSKFPTEAVFLPTGLPGPWRGDKKAK